MAFTFVLIPRCIFTGEWCHNSRSSLKNVQCYCDDRFIDETRTESASKFGAQAKKVTMAPSPHPFLPSIPFFVHHLTTLNSCYVRHLPAKHDVRATRSSRCIEDTSEENSFRVRGRHPTRAEFQCACARAYSIPACWICIVSSTRGEICTFDERVSSFFYRRLSYLLYEFRVTKGEGRRERNDAAG